MNDYRAAISSFLDGISQENTGIFEMNLEEVTCSARSKKVLERYEDKLETTPPKKPTKGMK